MLCTGTLHDKQKLCVCVWVGAVYYCVCVIVYYGM